MLTFVLSTLSSSVSNPRKQLVDAYCYPITKRVCKVNLKLPVDNSVWRFYTCVKK